MPGFQIGSSCEGWNLDSREMDLIYKTCEDLGAVLFVHPWDMQMGGRMSKYWLPWLVRILVHSNSLFKDSFLLLHR